MGRPDTKNYGNELQVKCQMFRCDPISLSPRTFASSPLNKESPKNKRSKLVSNRKQKSLPRKAPRFTRRRNCSRLAQSSRFNDTDDVRERAERSDPVDYLYKV